MSSKSGSSGGSDEVKSHISMEYSGIRLLIVLQTNMLLKSSCYTSKLAFRLLLLLLC